MLKYIILLVLFTVQQPTIIAQQVSGEVIYRQKINMEFPDIQDDTLRFNQTRSIFYWNTAKYGNVGLKKMKKKFPNAKPAERSIKIPEKIFFGLRVNVFDTSKDSLFSLMGMHQINKLLYLKEKAPKINWQLLDSTKKIGNYTVKKASAHFRGRDYTAWFTPQIPVPYGPWKLHRLPGLILQAYDHSGNIYFSIKKISFMKVGSIEPITLDGNEEVIDLAEYKNILSHFKRYMKRTTMKEVRPYLSKEDFANLRVHLPDIQHMEKFNEGNAKN